MIEMDFGKIKLTESIVKKIKERMIGVDENVIVTDDLVSSFLDDLQERLLSEDADIDLLCFIAESYIIMQINSFNDFDDAVTMMSNLNVTSEAIH